jgi:hypothetical protein
MRRKALLLTLFAMAIFFGATDAQAQSRRRGGSSSEHTTRFEINPFGGYVWTGAREVYYNAGFNSNKIDIKDSGFWGVALDANVSGTSQVELLYRRQESELTVTQTGFASTHVADVAVEYYQIGGLSGVRRDNLMGFGGFTLGATRLVYDETGFDEDLWKFSMVFSLGAKTYINDRFGLRVQGSLPFTFISGGGSLGCGSGGCYTTVGGEGVGQFNVSGGLIIQM